MVLRFVFMFRDACRERACGFKNNTSGISTCLAIDGKPSLGSLRPLQLHGHQVVRIRALSLNGVSLPPGEITSELESG